MSLAAIHGILEQGGELWTPKKSAAVVMWHNSQTGVTKDAQNLVSAVGDSSGKSMTFSQGTAALMPTYVENGLNGLPALRFYSSRLSSPTITLKERTYFMVCTIKGAPKSGYHNLIVQAPPYAQLYFPNAGPGNIFLGSAAYSSNINYAAEVPMLIEARILTTKNQVFINEKSGPEYTHPEFAAIVSAITIGETGANYANMDFYESVIYNGSLSADDAAKTRAYLKTKYGFTY